MHNMAYLIGRITNEEIKVKKDGTSIINIVVQRPYKDENGIYGTDFIDVLLTGSIATNVKEYCKKGDLVGVKGRLTTKKNNIIIIADKISFLASKRGNK